MIVMLCFLMILSSSALATDYVGNDNTIYEEKGQIDLKGVSKDLFVVGDALATTRSVSAEAQALLEETKSSKELEKLIVDSVGKNNQMIALGYTKVYVKEVQDAGGTRLEPMTAAETIRSEIMGMPQRKGKLSLYTLAADYNGHGANYIGVSVVSWSGYSSPGGFHPANYADYISISAPSNFGLMRDNFEALLSDGSKLGTNDYWRTDGGYSYVVYAFNELVNGKHVDEAMAKIYVTGRPTVANQKFESKYVHTYGGLSPSIHIETSGVTFSISSSKDTWQISSSLTVDMD